MGVQPVLIRQGSTTFSLPLPPHSLPHDLVIIDRSRPDWGWLATIMPGACPSGFVDPELKDKIEKEFMKRKEFMLADSPEKADLVFLIEGTYLSFYSTGTICTAPSGTKGNGRQVGVISVSGASTPSGPAGGASKVLQAAVAIAVPSDVYMRTPADSAALLAARVWAGAAVRKSDRTPGGLKSAEAGDLVGEFAKQKIWPAGFPPLCAAWTWPSSSSNRLRTSRNVHAMKSDGAGLVAPPVRAGTAPSGGETIHVDVTLVSVPAIVSDPDGKYIPDLRANDFHIFENGVEQHIDSVIPESGPFHVALELKYQYTLCYYPSNQSNDRLFRRIQVTLDRPGAKIRARAGYRVAAPMPEGK
jgi:hypothetical protein